MPILCQVTSTRKIYAIKQKSMQKLITPIQKLIKTIKKEAKRTDVENGFNEPWYVPLLVVIAICLLISLFL